MNDIGLLTWVTQLGLSVAAPLAGFILLAVWLRSRFDLGTWVIWVGVGLGLILAVSGLRSSLKTMERLARSQSEEPPAVSYNDHD